MAHSPKYIYYLVANQKSRFLASDFCVLVCFVCLVFFRFTNRLVFWRIVLLSISYSHRYNSQQVFGCLLIITYLWDQVKEKFGHIFPEQSGDPLTRNWTRQPEVYCLLYPKHTTVITLFVLIYVYIKYTVSTYMIIKKLTFIAWIINLDKIYWLVFGI
jgi:hypothetical protein